MEFKDIKDLDQLLKVAMAPIQEEGLGKGSMSKPQLMDLIDTLKQDLLSVPMGSDHERMIKHKIMAAKEQLQAIDKLDEVNLKDPYSFK